MFGIGYLELIILIGGLAFTLAVVVSVVVLAASRQRGSQLGNANLRPCPDCGQPISRRATTCPHCGAPTKGM